MSAFKLVSSLDLVCCHVLVAPCRPRITGLQKASMSGGGQIVDTESAASAARQSLEGGTLICGSLGFGARLSDPESTWGFC